MDTRNNYVCAAKFLCSKSAEQDLVSLQLDKPILEKFIPVTYSNLTDIDLDIFCKENGLHRKKLKLALKSSELDLFYQKAKSITVRNILNKLISGMNISEIAESLNLHPSLVWNVLKISYVTWQWSQYPCFQCTDLERST